MTIEEIFSELTKKSQEILEHYKIELGKIRTGRASPTLVENFKIECYGTMMPINQLANIKVPEARLILIEPWDKSVLSAIEKVLSTSDLGLTPNSDGQVIRINLPALTEERREELGKVVKKRAEDAKANLRTLRNKIKDHIKELNLSEDDTFRDEKTMQDEIDQNNQQIDKLRDKKILEIMEI